MCDVKEYMIMGQIMFMTINIIVRFIVTKKIIQNSIRNWHERFCDEDLNHFMSQ